jgi:sugar O-acyltransferase (sialic acid O-acetyltransferase NeuD family)
MTTAIIGQGKLSWLAEELINDDVVFYDDTVDSLKNTDECIEDSIFISVGNNSFREKMFKLYVNRNLLSVISPQSYISKRSKINTGALVSPFCTIHANANIGLGLLIYSNSVIDTDVVIGDFTRISSNCYVGNNSKIGNHCIINSNVTILPNVEIGDNCYIGAGSLVTKSFGSNQTIVGSPARAVTGHNEMHHG